MQHLDRQRRLIARRSPSCWCWRDGRKKVPDPTCERIEVLCTRFEVRVRVGGNGHVQGPRAALSIVRGQVASMPIKVIRITLG